MATVYAERPTAAQLEEKFSRLAAQWKRETAVNSVAEQICMHPAYQQIIGMGPPAVPYILRELEANADHWFWALYSITGIDPIPESSHGNMREMAEIWLRWGRDHGIV